MTVDILLTAWFVASILAFFVLRQYKSNDESKPSDYPGIIYHLLVAPVFGAIAIFALMLAWGVLIGAFGIEGRR